MNSGAWVRFLTPGDLEVVDPEAKEAHKAGELVNPDDVIVCAGWAMGMLCGCRGDSKCGRIWNSISATM